MDMEIERFIRDLESRSTDKKKTGYKPPDRRTTTYMADSLLESNASGGVASEMTGVMPASLNRGDEIVEYRDLFPQP